MKLNLTGPIREPGKLVPGDICMIKDDAPGHEYLYLGVQPWREHPSSTRPHHLFWSFGSGLLAWDHESDLSSYLPIARVREIRADP